MVKKMRDKDGHKGKNNQVEEGNVLEKRSGVLNVSTGDMDDVSKPSNNDYDKIKGKEDKNEKKDRVKTRKPEFDADEKESLKAHKKHKKSKDVVGEAEEISMKTCSEGKENIGKEHREAMYLENSFDWEEKRAAKKDKHKKKKNRDGIDRLATVIETPEPAKMLEPVEVQKICGSQDINQMVPGEENESKKQQQKKKQKLEKVSGNGRIAEKNSITDGKDTDKDNLASNEEECKKLLDDVGDSEDGNRGRKRKSNSVKNDSEGRKTKNARTRNQDIDQMVPGEENESKKRKKMKQKLEKVSGNGHIAEAEDGNRGRKKISKSVKNDSEGRKPKDERTRKGVNTKNQSENSTPKGGSKKVSFCDDVEVFPCTDDDNDANKDGIEGLVHGRRYSKEEDEIVMNAVANYIESHDLGDEGRNMVLNCGAYPEVKNCWKEIQAAIPWRPVESVYYRAHILLERAEQRVWTPEECEAIHKFVKEHGPNWRLLGDTLGKHRLHVKDKWRRTKLTNVNRGHWSQEEYQKLFDLVNMDLCMRALEEKKSKHGMLRDNIPWTAISDTMQTRSFIHCCDKWYRSLTSPMVAQGIWDDIDDYRMLDALSILDACCMEDVDWDNLLEHRSGDVCRKRWSQMIRHLGADTNKPFADQVEILANRYRPDLIDAKEAFDAKRPVDLP